MGGWPLASPLTDSHHSDAYIFSSPLDLLPYSGFPASLFIDETQG